MKKLMLITSTFILILSTSFVKNSTKKLEDQIFISKENIRILKTELGSVLLEYNYLSSPKKLAEFQNQYFENNLVSIDINKIKKVTVIGDRFKVSNFIKKD